MTALAALAVLLGFVLAGRVAVCLYRADRLLRRLLVQEAAQSAVERAARLGLVNPAPPRRWSHDRKPEPVPRVLDLMARH